jgi:diguanylate cyclase (GGDEF)-like protein
VQGKSKDTSNIVEIQENLLNREVEIELLQQTFAEIGSELDINRVFKIVAERARALIRAETLLIPIVNYGNDSYTYRAGSGANVAEIVGETLPLSYGICGWVFKHDKPWWCGVLNDLDESERTRWEKVAGTVILVPLRGKDGLLGGISGINKIGHQEFTRRDFNLLQMFASIVSVAIENAMVVQKMEESNYLKDNYRHQLAVLNKQLIESNKELERLALYDPLTALPNRSLFRDRLTRAIISAREKKQHIAVLLIDLDKFKNVNDVLGHDKGDRLLKGIADRMQGYVSEDETLARLGGDEFAIVMQQIEAEALTRARDLLHLLEIPFQIDGARMVVSGSIGIAMYPHHGHDVSDLLRHADSAMYHAKAKKTGVSVFAIEDDLSSLQQLTLVAEIRKALERKEFEIHYQPQLDLKSGKIRSVEALGRWRSGVLGEVAPDVFIHELEQVGLMSRYTSWLVETTLEQAMAWHDSGYDINISLNISVQDLVNPEFTLHLDRVINDRKKGRFLTFEITESLFLSDQDFIVELLEYIQGLGIGLSIDDFGTGYSSLSRLKKLPVNELKIDKSFIIDMEDDKDDELIVKSIIDLAHNLGLSVVAEGVENHAINDHLTRLGCDRLQGYHICRPMPADQLEPCLANRVQKLI